MNIRQQLESLANLIGGRAWGLETGKPRIYMPSARDRKIYFEFPDCACSTPDDEVSATCALGGARLVIFIHECGQSANWYASQRRQAVENHRQTALAVALFGHNPAWAEAVLEDDLTDDQVDQAMHEIINGRWDAAAVILGLR